MRTLLQRSILALASVSALSATGIADDFESYAPGTFPSPPWLDVATVMPEPGQPVPSALVVATTDAFGNPTQALGLVDQVSVSRGIYFPVPVSAQYSLSADIRPDRYSDAPTFPDSDWPMQLTFAQVRDNFAFTPQAGIYASALTKTWRLFLIGGPNADIDLGAPAVLGTWYRVQLDFNVLTATFHSRVTDILSGVPVVDQFNTIAGLTPADTPYDSIGFFGGEISSSTVANLAVVDNINISATGSVPEPSTSLLLTSSVALAFFWRRARTPVSLQRVKEWAGAARAHDANNRSKSARVPARTCASSTSSRWSCRWSGVQRRTSSVSASNCACDLGRLPPACPVETRSPWSIAR
jgi:hypothetical protein